MDEAYVTQTEFYKELTEVRGDVSNLRIDLTNRMTRLETHFNDTLKVEVARRTFRMKVISGTVAAAASLVVSILIPLIRGALGI